MADVEEAQEILKALGMPSAQHNRMSGVTLIALCELTPEVPWSSAKRGPCTVTKGIMDYLRQHYGTEYAPNTRETFRRQVLHQFVQGRIADYNPFDPSLPTNSPNAHYAITDAALEVVRRFGTRGWNSAVNKFRREQGALVERYERERDYNMVPIKLPDGQKLQFSPGKHNEVQKAIIEEFALGSLQVRTCFTLETRPRRTCSLTMPVSPNSASSLPTTTSCRMWYLATTSGTGCFSLRP